MSSPSVPPSVSPSLWQIHLLGGLRLQRGQETITRFRSQKFGALLAYLALFPHRLHSREELADLLWPEAEMEVGRGNVRGALSSLRRQLEPPGDAGGSVFVADGRTHLHLNADAIRTDVADFEAALAAASRAGSEGEAAARHLSNAIGLYAGPLLPGYYEPWALSERDRLAEAYLRALGQLSLLKERAGDADAALDYARRAVSADPLREESHGSVIRLLMASGQAAAAKRQFEELARLLKDSYDAEPEPHIKALLSRAATAPSVRPFPAPVPAPTPESDRTEGRADASAAPEAERVAGAVPQNFPVGVTRFFGREDEIEALRRRLREPETRLVTVTGPGGSGKTRVVAEVARELGDTFRAGIRFVPLVDVREADRVPDAVAAALGIPTAGAQTVPLLTQVEELLRGATAQTASRFLLVLDNFEQLADTASGAVTALLLRVPGLCCLVTSRQRLRIESEAEFPLLPLPVPEHPGTPERLSEFASVQLFVSRAQAARADFQLTGRNAASVATLCARLEGMPLAIELAAAWMGVLSPSQMLQRMTRRLDVLVSRRRDVSPRHRSLRAAIESSVALLPDAIRTFFASLSVFQGGWTLEAAEAVCTPNNEPFALEYLTELCDHSLVVRTSGSDGSLRFRMLETLREFAQEQQDEEAQAVTDHLGEKHARCFLRFAEEAAPHLSGSEQAEWLNRLQQDYDNLRAALTYLSSWEPGDALRLAVALFRFWQSRGPITEAHAWLEQGIAWATQTEEAVSADHQAILAKALEYSGTLAWYRSDLTLGGERLEQSIARYRELGDGAGVASAYNAFAGMRNIANDPDGARAVLERGLAEVNAMGRENGAAGRQILLEALTRDAVIRCDHAAAKRLGDEWLQLARATGDSHLIAAALTWMGFEAINTNEYDTARLLLREGVAVSREVNEALYLCSTLWGLGYIALFEGDIPAAGRLHREALRTIASLTGYDFAVVHIMTAIAMDALADSQPLHAARLLGAGSVLRQRLGYPLAPVLKRVDIDQVQAATRTLLGDSGFDDAFRAGAALTFDEAITEALRESDTAG